jgi:acyl-CoA synthetase (NDP forming)
MASPQKMSAATIAPRNSPEILFSFNSVVVVGASEDHNRIGGAPIFILRKYGYEGRIWGLNPKYASVQGEPCFATPEEIPESVDVAIFSLAAASIKDMLPRLKRRGLKGAVIFSAGFGESGVEGKALQAWLTSYARDNSIAILGPNCVGQISFATRRCLTFANAMKVLPPSEPGRVALLSQSGGVATNIWADAVLGGTGFSHVVTTGNEADLGFADYLNYLVRDPATDVVLGYIEALTDGAAFCEAAARMREAGKPLVLIKVGKSATGRDAVSSHTGLLSSDDAGYQAAFDRYGVIRASSLQDLNDYARVMSLHGVKPRITAATTSGGAGVYVADLCAELGIEMSVLSKRTERRLREIVPSFGRVRNPVDLTAQVVNDVSILATSLQILLDDPATGVLLFLLSGKGSKEQSEQAIAVFKQLQAHTRKTLVICWLGVADEVRMRAAQNGILVYQDPARFLKPLRDYFRVFGARTAHREMKPAGARARRAMRPRARNLDPDAFAARLVRSNEGRMVIPEPDCMRLLEAAGVRCPKRWMAESQRDLQRIAREVAFPCVMKIVSPLMAHKSEAGGVAMGLSSASDMVRQWQKMRTVLGATQVMIAEQIGRGVEVLVGCLRDETFGMRLTIGSGGIWTNFAKDTTTLVPPFDESYIRASLQRLSIWAPLSGARGQQKLAVDALVDTIAAIAATATALRDVASEFECNPVIVTAKSAVPVDAIAFA